MFVRRLIRIHRAASLTLVVALASACDRPEAPTQPAPRPGLAVAGAPIPFREVSAGDLHTCGVTSADRAYCWGSNVYGQLGDVSRTDRTKPVPVAPASGILLSFRQVSAGYTHSCGVTTTNVAYCWGRNGSGQLGDGTNISRTSPVRVAGGLTFARISVGERHTCGITTATEAYCWGYNSRGQLGDGTTDDRWTPVPVAGGLAFRLVSAGVMHSCGLVASTQLAYCWGENFDGQLGDGTFVRRLTPVAVIGGRQYRGLSAGGYHSCASGWAGDVYCWGDNAKGQAGGYGADRVEPVEVLVLGGSDFFDTSDVLDVEAGRLHTCAAYVDHRAYCWGDNYSGQLGVGSTSVRGGAVQVGGGLLYRAPSAGSKHTCVATAAFAGAYCWGDNSSGQLGDGTTTQRLSPTAVAQ